MAIFDIEKDELLRLSDTHLEELIARLAEAEVAANGHSPACVNWSGSITAPDGGIDIHVQVPVDQLSTGFIERPDTILQAKKHKMAKAAIEKEMGTGKELSSTISEQATRQGSYIIVSLGDDCSPLGKAERLKAMRDAVKDDPNKSNIHLDFYDRSKLIQWLRQHPSVMLWVKAKLGLGSSGWQPYGAWSNPPQGVVDTLISAPGVTISLPPGKGQKLNIDDAIGPMRALISATHKAVRITGLSGVGKTRIVQALFDETIGTDALDRTLAVYVDTGAEPEPSATAMLDRLIAEGRRAIMILDNCPSELHSSLASKVSAAGREVRLITIEYDIRDDKPQTTEVIHIEAVGPELAEQLLTRRFNGIGQNNVRRIAEFADGNARVSLAIAERVEEGESLAQLSDTQLFNRLFEQRNHPDGDLREQAEILSLVYSFPISPFDSGPNELDVLGSLIGQTSNQLYRAASKLLVRQIVQKRAHWRAILPQAIANKLAASALDNIPISQLRETFEATGRQRLLMSFAHRLGLLHDHPVATEIVEAWLQPEGLLGRITKLDDISFRMLNYIGPVAPEALLDRLNAELTSSNFEGMEAGYNPRRTSILNLLQLLAYESHDFKRSVRLLIRLADCDNVSKNNDYAQNKITRFYQAYLSGTHASLEQRVAIMNECLASDIAGRRSLGVKMLETALGGPRWTGFGVNEFGARPRDYGFRPNYNELAEWRSAFIDVAVRLGTSGIPDFEDDARMILANKFQAIWRQEAMRVKLIDAARTLHAYRPWGEGWKAVRSTIYFLHTKNVNREGLEPLPDMLAVLERELEPTDLIPKIMAYVLCKGRDYWALSSDFAHDEPNKLSKIREHLQDKAFLLGQDFAASSYKLDELGPNLFLSDGMPYRTAFGRGLAKGAHDLRVNWTQLIVQLDLQPTSLKDFSVICGYIEESDSIDSELAQELLEQCAQHSELRRVLVNLHPRRAFTEIDLDRCMAILNAPEIRPIMYGAILWRQQYTNLPEKRVLALAQGLLSKPNGEDVVLEALSMRLPDKEEAVDTLGHDLRLVGLRAAILKFQRDDNDSGNGTDYNMARVVSCVLRFDGHETEKLEWLNTIFSIVDKHYGNIYSFENSIGITAALMPEEFLNRIFEGTAEQQRRRLNFIRYDGLSESPLVKIDIGVLIAWCRARTDPRVWASVATGICLWSEDSGQDVITLLDEALMFLEVSPEPRAVLESFAERVTPSSWSGSQANVMQLRANAIGKLVKHKRADIAEVARAVYEKLIYCVELEKEREQREDEEREQRYE
ncbi:hypothetical protein RHD99_11110 [Buttiauxella selenatireducens]|uniref:ATP-binding protein n=1 Tax=Buttiauxella selenatireducens TaxID=3073902 RepID=A0ABY9SJ34_9ENTR|nr:hypothetical protein [Buttiauxella sp. R73]WMY76431.1 hypothetical protein RHD99_11110 [Buttiauxella sp. R73]